MSVTEVSNGGVGGWSVTLNADTPADLLAKIDYFGHIAICSGQDNPVLVGDSILQSAGARFVGPLLKYNFEDDDKVLSGFTMNYWMGDADNKGYVRETELFLNNVSFTSSITQAISGAVTVGGIEALSGLHKGQYIYKSARQIVDYICSLYLAEWFVDNSGKIWVGTPGYLYGSTPNVAIIKHVEGFDLNLRALPGETKLTADMEDFTTRVVMLANASSGSDQVVTSTADISGVLNPYKDLYGNAVKLVRMMQENDTSDYNASARAQVNLNLFTSPNETFTLDLNTSDICGDIRAGSYVWIHDESSKLVDFNNSIVFRGEQIYPVKLRVFELTWPIEQGMGVYFRHWNGTWSDLTPYVQFEQNDASITVGQYDNSVTGVGGGTGTITGVIPSPEDDTTIPGQVVWSGTPFATSVFQNITDGTSVAQIKLTWTQPLNTDSSVIVDGAYYEIQYRRSSDVSGGWQSSIVGFDFNSFNLQGLVPATQHDFKIRAVDSAKAPHLGAFSTVYTQFTAGDSIAPPTPAVASIASNMVSVQVTHNLGAASGGTFNLDADLHHLNVYLGTSSGFTPSISNKIGSITANIGDLISEIPVIKTFQISQTTAIYIKVTAVDLSGNESGPSVAAIASATLIDDAHITDLTATKITTGNLSATYAIVGTLRTAPANARFEASSAGWKLFRSSGTLAIWGKATTGDLIGYATDGTTETLKYNAATGNTTITGDFQTALGPDRMVMTNASGDPTIYFYTTETGATDNAFITVLGDAINSRIRFQIKSGKYAPATNRGMSFELAPDLITLNYEDKATGNFLGGLLQLTSGNAAMSNRNPDGSGAQYGGRVTTDTSGVYLNYFLTSQSQSNVQVGNGFVSLNAQNSGGTVLGQYISRYGGDTEIKTPADILFYHCDSSGNPDNPSALRYRKDTNACANLQCTFYNVGISFSNDGYVYACKNDRSPAPYSGSAYAVTSSAITKENIKNLEGNFRNKLLQIKTKEWNYKNDDKKHFFPVAEELEKIAPELVTDSENTPGGKLVDIRDMIGFLLQANQEQEQELISLRFEINKLKIKNS